MKNPTLVAGFPVNQPVLTKAASPKTFAPIIYSHTALRGMAAMIVIIYHLVQMETKAGTSFLNQFFYWGGSAVDLFFILSGFILNWVYLSGEGPVHWRSYLMARVARILPLYYLTTLIFSPLLIYSLIRHGTAFVGNVYPVDLILNLFLVSGITGGWKHTINGPAWSISVEFFCYLTLFPLLAYFKKSVANKSYSSTAFVIMAVVSTIGLVAAYDLNPIPIWHWHWDSFYLVRGICGFTAGFCLCSLYRKISEKELFVRLINFVIPVSLAVCLLVALNCVPGYLTLCTFPFLVLFSAADRGIASTLFKTKPLQWLGERSYSIYLWHMICIVHSSALEARLSPFAYNLIIMAVILGVAELSYRFFETPLREFIRTLGRTRLQPA